MKFFRKEVLIIGTRKKSLLTSIFIFLMLLCFNSSVLATDRIISLRSEVPGELCCSLEEEQEFIELIKERVDSLVSLGVSPDFFEGLWFRVYPANGIPLQGEGDEVRRVCGYFSLLPPAITLATNTGEATLYHELGHAISAKKIGNHACDWTTINEIGREYIAIKKYSKKLDRTTQRALPWEERLSEWFAEDVKQFMLEKIAEKEGKTLPPNNGSFGIYRGVGPEKTEEVDRFLEQLVLIERLG